MKNRDELVLRTAKEVAVKYIETGLLSLNAFSGAFKTIYKGVDAVLPGKPDEAEAEDD